MTTLLQELIDDPARYATAFDGDHVAFRAMTRDSYARSLFLDARIVAADDVTTRVPVGPLLAGARAMPTARRPIHYIFHVAHCGSTLLARALERGAADLVLREPAMLRQLGLLRASEGGDAPPREWDALASLASALLGKRYRANAPVILKANVPVNFMADWLLARQPDVPSLFLYHGFEDYLLAVLRSDDHRGWVMGIGNDLYRPLEAMLDPLDALEPARVAAALWLTQMRLYQALLLRHPRTRSLDAEVFYARPADVLAAVFALFGVPVPLADVEAIVAGPLFARYAKNPDVAFDEASRRTRRDADRVRLRPELDDARAWLDAKLADFPIAGALAKPLIGESPPLV